ncbi:glycosyltransferase family 4 protein [Pararhodobacter sp.]|uniref:glycosyltransferase family 4 protein n=1 Tax=Pararhodobacter sp. TaxID=2127056 RepID=UPI002FDDD135
MSPAARLPDRVVVISDYSRECGGASRLALLLADRLLSRQIPVTVFSGDLSTPEPASEIAFAGVSGASLLKQRKASALMRGIWNRPARQTLSELVQESDTPGTVYHVHGFFQTLSPSIFASLHPVRERVVIHAHDYFLTCPNGAYFDYQRRCECPLVPLSLGCAVQNCDKRNYPQKIWRVVRQLVLNRLAADFFADARIILLHDDMRAYLERGGRKIAAPCTIRNPAQPFLAEPATPEAHQPFLFVGDIHTYKGVFELAAAARKAKVPLWFAGDGAERQQLQTQYPEFRYVGWQNRTGLAALARQARAVVVPSLGPEPFGLTLVEALACGVPVIVSDRALLAGEIKAAGAGLTFRAGDSDDLAAVLARAAADDGLIRRMAQSALAAGKQFAKPPESWVNEIVALYGDMLGPRRATLPASQGTALQGEGFYPAATEATVIR